MGDEVEVRDASSFVQRPRWFPAIVRQVGGENDIVREIVGGADLEHFDSLDVSGKKKKKVPLLLLGRTRQVSICSYVIVCIRC